MDTLLLIKAAIMGIVEGLTEFLPVSSTGHLILAEALLKPGVDENVMHAFEVAIQPGAILAIFIVYWQLISKTLGTLTTDANSRRLITNILVGFLPAAVIGFAIHKQITQYLFNGPVVAGAFIVGALMASYQLPGVLWLMIGLVVVQIVVVWVWGVILRGHRQKHDLR